MVISKKLAFITIGILICILLSSPLIDQQISNYFMNQDSIFGTLFQNYGLFPPTLILIISTVILNYYILTTFQNKLAKTLTLILSFIFTLIKTNEFVSETAQYMLSTSENIKNHKPMGMANNEGNAGNALSLGMSFFISLIIIIIITIICYQFWLKHTNNQELDHLFKVSLISFMILFIGLELVDSLKHLWGRFRPYEITDKAGHFTHWLTINGNTGHSSFPSGHTGNGAFLMFIAFYFKKLRTQKIVFSIGLCYS
ncbi:MAG: phosphatase PAP2 family protein, partial [Staphylococcus lugdunensis]|nr:phosphatase PAP2 family protein [Staphylococcus lugdunensis]